MINHFYGYIRVSTAKQGEQGVSLTEQRDAIAHYAERNGLEIAHWFEERETAAKRGRPIFGEMMKLLRQGKVAGLIIHKIDRSARNMKDWAEVGELIDSGIDVRFANEGLDLNTRGGRLSADIQAVVAADFIRNLREETKKGFYGRLKQGLYPMPAPLGYLDRGQGKPKEIDPVKGPLIRRAFELYATGTYNMRRLADELDRLGLRNRGGGKVSLNGLSTILNNPFYAGIIRLRTTGESFSGTHAPLVSAAVFRCVQDVLAGKTTARAIKHDFLFRRLLRCKSCDYSLIGEFQKGHVYYRCHTQGCTTTGIREESVESAVLDALAPLRFTEFEQRYLRKQLDRLRVEWKDDAENGQQVLALRLGRIQDRVVRLTDAYLDGVIDRGIFEERKTTLLMERQGISHQLERGPMQPVPDRLTDVLELAGSAYVSYKVGLPEEKRDLLDLVTSNRLLDDKMPVITLRQPFREVASRVQNSDGTPRRSTPRTLDRLLCRLGKWLRQNPEAFPVELKKDDRRVGFGKDVGVAA